MEKSQLPADRFRQFFSMLITLLVFSRAFCTRSWMSGLSWLQDDLIVWYCQFLPSGPEYKPDDTWVLVYEVLVFVRVVLAVEPPLEDRLPLAALHVVVVQVVEALQIRRVHEHFPVLFDDPLEILKPC